MTKAQRADRDEAIAQLRDWIKPGDTVYTILDNVSRSGMSRAIRVLVPAYPTVCTYCGGTPNTGGDTCGNVNTGVHDFRRQAAPPGAADFIHPNWAVGKALQLRHWKRNGREQDALVMGGCGMDMGFALVYELSHVLYGGRTKHCPTCEGNTYIGTIGTDEQRCPTCKGKGLVTEGGYRCLGQGKCPSNYHVNYRRTVRCPDEACRLVQVYRTAELLERGDTRRGVVASADALARLELWTIPVEEGDEPIPVPYRYMGIHFAEDGNTMLKVCPTCDGKGELPNPDGAERFDLVHTDGYALRHKWL